MLKVIIVEDEWHSQETLRNMISEFCDGVEVVAVADSVESGMEAIGLHHPDVIFLDIEMADGTGFDLLQRFLTINFEVVFTTAYDEYALKAFRFNALDYLLKPIDLDELKIAIEKVKQRKGPVRQTQLLEVLLQNMNQDKVGEHKITISTAEGYEFLEVSSIIYCEADGAYTNFILKDKRRILVSKHLKEYENLLLDYDFYRSHNSFLINTKCVSKYIKANGGSLIMNNGDEVSISLKKKDFLLKLLFSK